MKMPISLHYTSPIFYQTKPGLNALIISIECKVVAPKDHNNVFTIFCYGLGLTMLINHMPYLP